MARRDPTSPIVYPFFNRFFLIFIHPRREAGGIYSASPRMRAIRGLDLLLETGDEFAIGVD